MKLLHRVPGLLATAALAALAGTSPVLAQSSNIRVQCPGDLNQNALEEPFETWPENQKCFHLAAGDGFLRMADGRRLYGFGFSDASGHPPSEVPNVGRLNASFPAPTIVVDEGDDVYLTLTNVGMTMRPDLFDPHSVHWHGFPNAATVFDGEPEASLGINMMASFTYYYHVVEPGTYLYHCHVEAAEHMQMGMLGNLWVRPEQNRKPDGTNLNGFIHRTGYRYAYNDGDGSTYYDVEFPLQFSSLDPVFHDASESVQPLPFAYMKDTYSLINGRGYPDTINPAPLSNAGPEPKDAQVVSSRIVATQGQKVLLRMSNVSITVNYSVTLLGPPMKVVGAGARLLRGPTGRNLYYETQTVTLGGGESLDVLLDTAGVAPGTYFLHASNLNYLSNDTQDYGGLMTELVVLAP